MEKLPVEILLLISDILDLTEINVLIQTCKYMLNILEPLLYQRALRSPKDAYKSRFLYAATHGQAGAIFKFLKAGVSMSEFKFYTRGYLSVRVDSIESMSAAKRATSRVKMHPLLAAALFGHVEVVALLLNEDNMDINFQDRSKKTALRYATEGDHLDVVKLLLEKGATIMKIVRRSKITNSSFTCAADVGNKSALEMMFKELKNRSTPENIIKKQCERACYVACVKGFANIVEFLLCHGVDANLYVERRGLLFWASDRGNLATVKTLVIHGARMEKERDCGIVSALYHDRFDRDPNSDTNAVDVVTYLLESGCNVANGGLHACALWRIAHASTAECGYVYILQSHQKRIAKLLKKNGFDQKKCRNKCWEGKFNEALGRELRVFNISRYIRDYEAY